MPHEVIVKRRPSMRKQVSLDTESASALSLDFSASKTVISEFALFLNLGYFVIVVPQPERTKTVTFGKSLKSFWTLVFSSIKWA